MKSRHLASQFYHFKIDFPSPPNISIEYIRATFSPIPKRRRKLELDRIEGISQFCVDWFFRGNTLLFIQDNNTRVKFIKTFHIRKDRFASEYNFDRDFFNRRFDRRKKERRLELISTRQNVLIVTDRNWNNNPDQDDRERVWWFRRG